MAKELMTMRNIAQLKQGCHRIARELLVHDFLWDRCDYYGPLGSDNGSDAFNLYQKWRIKEPSQKWEDFLSLLLRVFELEAPVQVLDIGELVRKVASPEDERIIQTWDQAIVAVAFAQLIIDGRLIKPIADLAIEALKREQIVADIYLGKYPQTKSRYTEAQEKRTIMKDALTKALVKCQE